jgi:hypothetical protein
MSEDLKKEMRQLIMLVSSIRSQDTEHWESHVEFSNQVIDFMKKIQENTEANWQKLNTTLLKLDSTIENSMESLLSGINPQGIKETSKYLKEIQDSMEKSMMSMNLESIMQELGGMAGGRIKLSSRARKGKKSTTQIASNQSSPYSDSNGEEEGDEEFDELGDEYTPEEQEMIKAYQEIYGPGHIPEHLKKGKKDKDDYHLLKPSDFFG